MPDICPVCGETHRSQSEVEADDMAAKQHKKIKIKKAVGGGVIESPQLAII